MAEHPKAKYKESELLTEQEDAVDDAEVDGIEVQQKKPHRNANPVQNETL